MADRKITDLTALAAGSQATGDLLTIVDVSEGAAADKNKKITVESLFQGIPSNVGIGTSSPNNELHVSGSGAFSGTASSLSNDQVQVGFEAPEGFIKAKNSSGSPAANLGLYTTNGSGTTSKIVHVSFDGNVGIGTTSPSSTLDVAGGVNLTSNLTFSTTTSPFIAANAASSVLRFGTGSGGVERARIDSSGRLLVGTTSHRNTFFGASPAQIHLEQATGIPISAVVSNSNDTGPSYFALCKSRGAALGSHTAVQANDFLGVVSFQGADGDQMVEAARIDSVVDSTPGNNDMPGMLRFATTADGANSPTERMRIDSKGSVSIASAAGVNDWRLYVLTSNAASTGFGLVINNTGGSSLFVVRNDGVVQCGNATNSPYNLTTAAAANVHVDSAGTLYRSTSSRRFKTSIETIQDSYSDAILNIEPVWYRSTAPGDTEHSDWSHYGFIAEDVAEIDPRLVFWKTHEAGQDENGAPTSTPLDEPIAEGVQYNRFVPHLLNLIKRQQQAIETLETKVAALEAG